jgi:hypothetical protein
MRRQLVLILAALTAAALTTGLAAARDDDDHGRGEGRSYAVGLWGDVPYSAAQSTVGVPNLVSDLNRQRLAFSVHDGDIKSGGTRCDDNVYAEAEAFMNALRSPAMYTPGDNEWTDCDRANNGSYLSSERLQYIRSTMFDTPYSFGRRRVRLEVQADPYVENRRWQFNDVTYATLHVVGSNNNLGDVDPDPAEWAARDAATNAWLRETFDRAEAKSSAGVMLIIQANPGFDMADPARAPTRDPQTLLPEDGFFNLLTELRREVIEFGKPVVLVHGDSHYFRVDKPLLDRNGNRIEHFTRVETPGNNAQSESNDVQWVKVTVSSSNPEVFDFEQEVIPGNLVPYVP